MITRLLTPLLRRGRSVRLLCCAAYSLLTALAVGVLSVGVAYLVNSCQP